MCDEKSLLNEDSLLLIIVIFTASAAASPNVHLPDLVITKTAGQTFKPEITGFSPGDLIYYTIYVINMGTYLVNDIKNNRLSCQVV